MTYRIYAIALGCTLLCTSRAWAENWEAGLFGGIGWTPMQSMDAITSSNSYGLFGLRGSAVLPSLPFLPGFQPEIELRWQTQEISGDTFQSISSSLDVDSVSVGGRLRRDLAFHTSAFAGIAAGLSWADLELSVPGARTIADSSAAIITEASLGADVNLSPYVLKSQKGVSAHLRAELGYTAATSLSFRSEPKTEANDLPVETRANELGSVNTSGPLLRFSAVVQF